MRYLEELREGDRISGIYLCKQKQSAVTKNGKPYDSIILQDKTGVLDGKIWDPNSQGICDFDALDYIEAVSYTHLDVYKRQIIYRLLLLGGRSVLPGVQSVRNAF